MHGCRVWANDYPTIITNLKIYTYWQNSEEVQKESCKLLLCVGGFISSIAARVELGRYPLMLSVAALE